MNKINKYNGGYKMKIHCVEMQKEDFDKTLSVKKLQEMVGWIEPPETEGGTWDVTMSDGSGFECKDQATAQILASIEEVKALLLEKNK